MPDALQLLRQDHQEVKDLFKRFEGSDDTREKEQICNTAIIELVVHSMIEEEIFYPAVRRELADQEEEVEIMNEAEEEHHVVDLLIEELNKMSGSDENFDAKFKVLAENVKHHIQEEESMMLPKAAELGSDRLNELGEAMYERKMELMEEFRDGGARRSSNGRTPRRRTSTRRTSTGRGRTTTRTTGRSTGTRRTSTRGTTRGRTGARRTAGGARSTARRAATRTASTAKRVARRTTAAASRTRTGSKRSTSRSRR
jgi:hypothetical protein